MKCKKTVLFLGANGFPFGSAMIQRQLQLAKSLIKANYTVVVICRRGFYPKAITKREGIKYKNKYQGIKYYYASLIPYKPKDFVIRNLLKVVGFINEVFIILWYRLFKNCRYVFNNSTTLSSLKYYYYLSKIFKIKFIYDYVEIISSLGKRNIKSIDEIKATFDYKFPHYTDSIISISSFLESHLKEIVFEKKMLKIPPIIDFSFFEGISKLKNDNPYFLFCGSAAYYDVIKFIISAFSASEGIKKGYSLKLVVNGTEKQLKQLKDYILKTDKANYIEVLSQLNYKYLISLYKSSFALLIPLSDSLQDKARFPFKISEYTAAKRPIITSDSGPIEEFFKDRENALIAKKNNLKDFSLQMNYLINNPKLADIIGLKGYDLGNLKFNYKTYSKNLKKFIETK